jgi:hypothetical protein
MEILRLPRNAVSNWIAITIFIVFSIFAWNFFSALLSPDWHYDPAQYTGKLRRTMRLFDGIPYSVRLTVTCIAVFSFPAATLLVLKMIVTSQHYAELRADGVCIPVWIGMQFVYWHDVTAIEYAYKNKSDSVSHAFTLSFPLARDIWGMKRNRLEINSIYTSFDAQQVLDFLKAKRPELVLIDALAVPPASNAEVKTFHLKDNSKPIVPKIEISAGGWTGAKNRVPDQAVSDGLE